MLEMKWPYKRHVGVFAGTQRYAEERGWDSIIDEHAGDTLPMRRSKAIPYDGVIGRATKKLAERASRLGVPVVNVWFTSPVRGKLPGVFADFAASGRMRAEHLLTRGLNRFAAMSCEDRGAKVEVVAFREVVQEAGFPCLVINLPLDPTRSYATQQKSEARIEEWMNQWQLPIGIFVYSDDVGRIVAQMVRRRGWRVPEDVAIITGANEEKICEHPRPSLTSVELGYERIGYQAAQLLDKLMNDKGRKKTKAVAPEHILVPPQALVVRESTDFYAVDDELVAQALVFIAANSHRSIGADDVAEAVSMETRTLQRRFRKILDRPIATEIRRVRIERAKRELAQSKRTMAEIAHAVGFGESMRMYEVFRRELGVTPTEFRQQRQLENGM